jgi:hypothetical protein
MKKIYIQPDCQTVLMESGSVMIPASYGKELGSRRSNDDFWEDEPANGNGYGRSRSEDFDDEEEDY